MSDLDNLEETNLSPDWNHATKRGKTPRDRAWWKSHAGATAARRGGENRSGGTAVTMDERIEAARRHLGNKYDHHTMRGVLAGAFPELFGPSPTHWIAPNDADQTMLSAARLDERSWASPEGTWTAMRSAYLGEGK